MLNLVLKMFYFPGCETPDHHFTLANISERAWRFAQPVFCVLLTLRRLATMFQGSMKLWPSKGPFNPCTTEVRVSLALPKCSVSV